MKERCSLNHCKRQTLTPVIHALCVSLWYARFCSKRLWINLQFVPVAIERPIFESDQIQVYHGYVLRYRAIWLTERVTRLQQLHGLQRSSIPFILPRFASRFQRSSHGTWNVSTRLGTMALTDRPDRIELREQNYTFGLVSFNPLSIHNRTSDALIGVSMCFVNSSLATALYGKALLKFVHFRLHFMTCPVWPSWACWASGVISF